MPEARPVSSLNEGHRVLRIVHLALTASLVFYGIVVHAVTRTPPDPPPPGLEGNQPLLVVLAILALALVVAQPTVRNRFQPARERVRPTGDPLPPGPLSQAARTAMGRWFSAQIISWALTEAIATLGVVLALITYEAWLYYPFWAVALIQMLLLAPTRDDLEAVVRAANRGGTGSPG